MLVRAITRKIFRIISGWLFLRSAPGRIAEVAAALCDRQINWPEHILPFAGEGKPKPCFFGNIFSARARPIAAAAVISRDRQRGRQSAATPACRKLYGPQVGVDCVKCSVLRTTMIRTITLRTNPTTKLKPAEYFRDRSARSKVPGGLSLCTMESERHIASRKRMRERISRYPERRSQSGPESKNPVLVWATSITVRRGSSTSLRMTVPATR